MTIEYGKTKAHGYTYWTIRVNGHFYKENGQKKLFTTKKDAQFYVENHIQTGTEFTVNNLHFQVWSNTVLHSTNALCLETGEAKIIHPSKYFKKDTTIIKAITNSFALTVEKTKAEGKKVLTDEQKAKKAARAKARREARKAAQA